MASPILVTGGTGTLGRLVVRRVRDAGCDVRVLSRRNREAEDRIQFITGDLVKGEGIEPAVDGVAAIVHCASSNKGDADATRNLVRAASSRAGAPHLAYISIVGVDKISFGYLRSKLEAERVVAGSGLPWTTLRVTQFYDLILTGAEKLAKLPVVPVPAGFRVQPIDADEVAARLVELNARRAGGPGARHGWSASVQLCRFAAGVFAGHSSAPAGRAGLDAGYLRNPCRRSACRRAARRARADHRPPDVGGVPGREAVVDEQRATGAVQTQHGKATSRRPVREGSHATTDEEPGDDPY